MIFHRFRVAATASVLGTFMILPSGAQNRSGADCAPYIPDVIKSGGGLSAPALSDKLLADWTTALPCLIKAIEQEKDGVKSPEIDLEVRAKLLRTTGAIRTIMANNNSDDALKSLIGKFRSLDNLDVMTVLSFGARSNDYNLRLNSILILANVIDNTTVCVPIDHLYAPDISVNGRANLLGVVSVVAPWAYKENYNNIERARQSISVKTAGNSELKQTNDILQNIQTRLAANSENKNNPLPGSLGRNCRNYAKNPLWAKDNLIY
jgi:hypothetical protein